ncbi:MAG: carboxypeptidase regulatory-like domain-containing protein [Thermoguttaceae bacterium]|nr:carboxypeptidase regulatory-like domain-containing protein [Thermoguttaceae bacterium]
MKIESIALLCSATLFVASGIGCGAKGIPGLVTVEGTVLYEGAPLPWASVAFAPDPEGVGAGTTVRVSTGMTDENGKFSLNAMGRKGALPGDYVVMVEKFIPNAPDAVETWEKRRASGDWSEKRPSNGYVEDEPSEEGVDVSKPTFDVVSAIPLRYSDKDSSGLKATVPAKGIKDLTIELSKESTEQTPAKGK